MIPLSSSPVRPATPATTSSAAARERDALVQKLESLSLLSGGVAHDFNNLLMTILGNADLALSVADENSSELRNYLEEIQGASKRAADFCHQLLGFAGRGRDPMGHVEIKPLIEQMACSLGQTVGDGVSLSYELPDDVPSIRGNPDALREMLKNVVRNAREAMPEPTMRGEIRLSLAPVNRDDAALRTAVGAAIQASSTYLRIEIADDGEGMDSATKARMLDPFFTTRGAGRGLGLTSAFGTVQAHLGRLGVESRHGLGTRVSIFLPALEVA